MSSKKKYPSPDETPGERRNEDPITGEPGAHPVGAGLGAAVGGAAAGAAAGSLAGPVGTVAGAVVGGIAGAAAGKSIAENVNPTEESEYWRAQYSMRPYYHSAYTYPDYEPAYRLGWESYVAGEPWQDHESDWRLRWEQRWENEGGTPRLSWDEARLAARDAYERLETKHRTRHGAGDTTDAQNPKPR